MPNYTQHYNAKKPSKSENYDIEVANFNNDLWDEKIFEKQDKIAGKSLSTNDFTNGYKTKLDNLENYDDTEVKQDITNIKQQQTTQNTNIEKNSNDIETNKTNIIELQKKHNKEIQELESLIPFRTS